MIIKIIRIIIKKSYAIVNSFYIYGTSLINSYTSKNKLAG